MESNVVLTMRGITMTFPGVKALDHVDLTLRKGEIMALMGENGAGKSTLIKCLTGINAFEAGEIHVEGIDGPVVNHSTLDAQKKGISTVYQEVNLCPNLSVAENLFIGREPKTKLGTIDWKTMVAKSEKIMDSLDIKIDVTQNLEEYSLALQQMIAIARAVDMECKVLILDEPTSSLDDHEVEKLFTLMRQLKEKGVAIVFVTHFLEQVYAVCDRITVLRNGKLVGEYPIEELPRVRLVAAMMGKDFDDLAAVKTEQAKDFSKEPLFIDAKGLSHKGKIKPFDLQIHKGEVVIHVKPCRGNPCHQATLSTGIQIREKLHLFFSIDKSNGKHPELHPVAAVPDHVVIQALIQLFHQSLNPREYVIRNDFHIQCGRGVVTRRTAAQSSSGHTNVFIHVLFDGIFVFLIQKGEIDRKPIHLRARGQREE